MIYRRQETPGDRRSPSPVSERAFAVVHPVGEDISPTTGVLLATVLFASIQALLIAQGRPALFAGELWDPDSYMWLERARWLWDGGGWFDHLYPRIDPPAGFVSHWTRPMDAVLLAGSWALAPVLGFDRALFWWGAATGPLLFVATAFATVWATRPLLPRQILWLPPLILTTQPAILASFATGRPDHQNLLTLLFALILGAALRMALTPERRAPVAAAALFAALALWTSVQMLPLIGVVLLGLSLAWIFDRPGLARSLAFFLGLLSIALVAALFAEYGAAAFAARPNDTLSPSHLALFAMLLVFWGGAAALRGLGRDGRMLYVVLGGAALGAALWLWAPDLFTRPVGPIDPLYRDAHLARIRELQPTFVPQPDAGWLAQIATPVLRLGIAVPALFYLLARSLRRHGGQRYGWTLLTFAAALYVTLAILQLRWTNFAIMTVLAPYVGLVYIAMRALTRAARRHHLHLAVRPIVTAFACLWTFIPALLAQPEDVLPGAAAADDRCPLSGPAQVLAEPWGLGARAGTVLAFPDHGPELLYRTPHAVLSIPNHRPQPGFTLTHRIMSESDPETALSLLRERGVDFVLVCFGAAESEAYRSAGAQPSLYQRLAAGAAPDGLAPVAIPADRGGAFRLFEVRSSGE